MVPGRNACYNGLTLEYAGYLMAERHNHASNKTFVCVDGDAEVTNCSSGGNEDGAFLYVVESSFNPLKCPPYVSGRELTCVRIKSRNDGINFNTFQLKSEIITY
ncbi:hypothetical protein DPMN_161498 [Dreissena polymorpha]|uniref:Uncharacterized protein n=1 Tax=Dreissena polymorpha TaxID=45954 RepID=A0A9D4EPR6_DREPO|nr:hypothetical protein DPMN_161498 [Dreissena polymorpha]